MSLQVNYQINISILNTQYNDIWHCRYLEVYKVRLKMPRADAAKMPGTDIIAGQAAI